MIKNVPNNHNISHIRYTLLLFIMNSLLPLLYFTFFAVIAGGAFAMMWGNIKFINEEMKKPKTLKHPEAPKEGDELLYVDLTKERLENLYNDK